MDWIRRWVQPIHKIICRQLFDSSLTSWLALLVASLDKRQHHGEYNADESKESGYNCDPSVSASRIRASDHEPDNHEAEKNYHGPRCNGLQRPNDALDLSLLQRYVRRNTDTDHEEQNDFAQLTHLLQ